MGCIEYVRVINDWAMPKSIWEFWKLKKGQKVAIFGRIWSNFGEKKVVLCL